MMDDRELLERAARAAGIYFWTDGDFLLTHSDTPGGSKQWNPLEDDGDAFRLIVALGLQVSYYGGDAPGPYNGGPIVRYFDGSRYDKTNHGWQSITESDASGKAAAYRRAIVRAAAALGGE